MQQGHRRKVLIIDDQELIASTLQKIFSNAGYEARALFSAEQALKLFAEGEWCPDLAIIDVCLTGINGLDLAVLMKKACPDCQVSLFSGQPSTGDILDTARKDGHSFVVLPKPVHPTEMLRVAGGLLIGTKRELLPVAD